MKFHEGQRVIINDRSEAQGDTGVVWFIQDDGLIVVVLKQGCAWVVTEEELMPEEEPIYCPFCKTEGFDLLGLKIHLSGNFCEEYGKINVFRY